MGLNDDLFEPEELQASNQKKLPMIGDLESIKEE